jgi:hypothetical protein
MKPPTQWNRPISASALLFKCSTTLSKVSLQAIARIPWQVRLFPLAMAQMANPLQAQVAPVARIAAGTLNNVLEMAAKVSGRSLPSETRILALKQLDNAALKHGHQVLDAARTGGVELIEVAAKHGDDVWIFSAKVPEAARLLATRTDELLPLTRRIGTEVLEIEAKNPGLAKTLATHFGDDAVRNLARKAPPEDIAKLAGLATKADSPATTALLFERYMEGGAEFLAKLPAKQILATGLVTAMVIGSYQVSDGLQEGLKTTAQTSPEVFAKTTEKLIFWILLPLLAYALGQVAIRLFKSARRQT